VSKINDIGWKHKTDIAQGIRLSYQDYLKNIKRWQSA